MFDFTQSTAIQLNNPFPLPQQKSVCVQNGIIKDKEGFHTASAGVRKRKFHVKWCPGAYLQQPFAYFLLQSTIFWGDNVLVIAYKNIRSVLDNT